MIALRRLGPHDLEYLAPRAQETMARDLIARGYELPTVRNDPYAVTVLSCCTPLVCGGFIDCGNGVALVWAVMAVLPKAAVLPVIRAMRRMLDAVPFHWIEAQTPETLPSGLKLDRMLGFREFGAPPLTLPDGRRFIRLRYMRTSDGN